MEVMAARRRAPQAVAIVCPEVTKLSCKEAQSE